jgi:hypothetical protein
MGLPPKLFVYLQKYLILKRKGVITVKYCSDV